MKKKSHQSLVVLMIASFMLPVLFISCPNLIDIQHTGSLSITTSVNSRTISPSSGEIGIVSYTVNGTYSDTTTTFPEVTGNDGPITVENLLVGTWTITVNGLNKDDQIIATKTQDVTIVARSKTEATFSLALIEGTGAVEITIQWPSSVTSFTQLKGTITSTVGFLVATSTAISSDEYDSITQTIEDLATGSYQFKLEFLDNQDIVVGLSYQDSLNIYKNMTSRKTYILDDVTFPLEAPVISMNSSYEVSITCANENVTLYYTTDGNDPELSSTVYESPFMINKNTTVKAFAVRDDRLSSTITEVDLEVPAASPTFSVAANTYDTTQTVELSTTTTGATIYYTVDGSAPTVESTEYTEAIQVDQNTTIKAITVHSDYASSAVSSAQYLIKAASPTFSVNGGTYIVYTTVALSSSTSGATIYYTLDGSTATIEGTEYTSPITINATTTVKAIAVKSNMVTSGESTATYVITTQHK